jgi:Tetratricopeptide repeat
VARQRIDVMLAYFKEGAAFSKLSNCSSQHLQSRPVRAGRALYKRAPAIREEALGPEHPDVAISLNGLAGLYRTQRQYAQAEPPLQAGAGDL